MKIYKKFKAMKNSTKIGLATSAVYSATAFALPVFANTVEKPVEQPVQPVFQPVDVTTITTSEQAEAVYKEKLAEYATDKFLSFTELENLSKAQGAKVELLKKENPGLIDEYAKKTEPIKKLDAEIKNFSEKLSGTYGYRNRVSPVSDLREKIEKEILVHYPALIDKGNGNITYSAEAKLNPKLVTLFQKIVLETDNILKEYYDESHLELLVNQDEYTLNEVLALYNIITQKRGNDSYLKKLRADLEDKIAQFEKEKVEIINSEQMVSLKGKLDSFNADLEKNSCFVRTFERYADLKIKVENFESKYKNWHFSKQFFISIVGQKVLAQKGLDTSYAKINVLGAHAKMFKDMQKASVYNFKKFAKAEGLEVEIETFKNPAKTIFPWWLGLLLGASVPLIRNILIKSYVKGEDATAGDYVGSSLAGMVSGVVGVVFIDGITFWVFPARMLTPFVLQPIFSYFKMDPCKFLEDF